MIVIVLWSLVIGYAICGGVVCIIWHLSPNGRGLKLWSKLPTDYSKQIGFLFDVDPNHGYPPCYWVLSFTLFVISQGVMTMGLHCSEVIMNVVRDEVAWREATSKTGTTQSRNPVATVLWSWPSTGLLVAKLVLHMLTALKSPFVTEAHCKYRLDVWSLI
jgi:hypothetical protein